MQRLFFLLIASSLILIPALSAQESISIPEDIKMLWEQAVAQPDDFGVACMPLMQQSKTVLYNAAHFPLASVSKLLIFIEYATRVDNGTIPLDETVSVATLDQYNLPRTDRGAHDRFIARYPAGITSLPLWDVATEGMMQYSSNAASDYVLHRLSPVDWAALYQKLGVYDATPPTPLTMIPLLMNNHVDGRATHETLAKLSISLGESYLDHYIQDGAWRQSEIVYRSGQVGGSGRPGSLWPSWDIQSAILQQDTATASVNDFRNVMNAIYGSSSLLTTNVQYIVRTGMKWESSDFVNANYVEYGAKLGFYSGGTLTLVAYGDPIHGDPIISVTFFRNIPQRVYRQLLDDDSIGNFAHWMNFNACEGLYPLIQGTLK